MQCGANGHHGLNAQQPVGIAQRPGIELATTRHHATGEDHAPAIKLML